MMPQRQQTNSNDIAIPTPITSGALDNPNAPQAPASANNQSPVMINTDEMFPLLSKSPGFKEALARADASGSYEPETTLPPSVVMQRHLKTLEESDLYKNATPEKRLAYQAAFYKKYVEPVNKAANYKGDFKAWARDRGTYWQGKVNPSAQDKPLGGIIPGLTRADEKKHEEALKAGASGVVSTVLHTAKALEEAKRTAIFHFQNITKEFSLGAAMLNATVAPHMGPIIMNPHYTSVREDKTEKKLDEYLSADEWYALNGYKQNLTNKIMRGAGEFAGQLPAFELSEGLLGKVGIGELLNVDKATGIAKIASKSIYNAAQGYLVGTVSGESGPKEAAGFGIGTAIFTPAEMFLGRIFGWAGGKGVSDLADIAIKDIKTKSPVTTVSTPTIALAGSQKQKISAAVISALNDLTGGNFSKAPEVSKKIALSKLAKVAPEFADQIAYIDQTIVGVDAAQDLVKQRAAVPELNNVLTKLEGASKQQTHESISHAANKDSLDTLIRNYPQKAIDHLYGKGTIDPDTGQAIRPGAASAKSLEFGENLTKHVDAQLDKLGLGKNKIQFEARGHKFLFYLNILMTDQQRLGPSKERNKVFTALLSKLQEEFPGDKGRLPNLLLMSDKVWSDIDQATKAGLMKEGEPFRYWRQHSAPGESPFAHEVKLLQQASEAESKAAESAKKVPQETEEEALNRRMREATQKVSGKDTMKLGDALKELYPGKKFEELTSEERQKVINRSLGKKE